MANYEVTVSLKVTKTIVMKDMPNKDKAALAALAQVRAAAASGNLQIIKDSEVIESVKQGGYRLPGFKLTKVGSSYDLIPAVDPNKRAKYPTRARRKRIKLDPPISGEQSVDDPANAT